MSEQGAAMQIYNQELVKCLEDLKIRRNELQESIRQEETEKTVLEKKMQILQEKLSSLNGSLEQRRSLYNNYSKTIEETERGFQKILESSQTLLQVVKQEAGQLDLGNKSSTIYPAYLKSSNTYDY